MLILPLIFYQNGKRTHVHGQQHGDCGWGGSIRRLKDNGKKENKRNETSPEKINQQGTNLTVRKIL